MSTVIIGGGIIGLSIAYYLSDPELPAGQKQDIHIIDSSPELFASASGYAAGFLAKDWFSPELAPLGALSFDLHRQLAKDYNGSKIWGYMDGTALNLQMEGPDGKKTGRGDDWINRGASRAEAAAMGDGPSSDGRDPSPAWLTKQKGGIVERISKDGHVAQVDPRRLCKFLMSKCVERGVHVHYPARPISLMKDPASGNIREVVIEDLKRRSVKTNIHCTNLVFAAGAWTPRAFTTLFPDSKTQIPVLSLSGYSLAFRSPRHTLSHELNTYQGKSHAVFTKDPRGREFSPEIFSRANAEIYIAGLNGLETPLPAVATDVKGIMEADKSARVRRVAAMLMGRPNPDSGAENIDDFEVVQEALCFRPYIENGLPIVARLQNSVLGGDARPSNGVFMAVGHGPWGISLSLGTGKVIAEMVTGVKQSADVSRLGLFEKMVSPRSRL